MALVSALCYLYWVLLAFEGVAVPQGLLGRLPQLCRCESLQRMRLEEQLYGALRSVESDNSIMYNKVIIVCSMWQFQANFLSDWSVPPCRLPVLMCPGVSRAGVCLQ